MDTWAIYVMICFGVSILYIFFVCSVCATRSFAESERKKNNKISIFISTDERQMITFSVFIYLANKNPAKSKSVFWSSTSTTRAHRKIEIKFLLVRPKCWWHCEKLPCVESIDWYIDWRLNVSQIRSTKSIKIEEILFKITINKMRNRVRVN